MPMDICKSMKMLMMAMVNRSMDNKNSQKAGDKNFFHFIKFTLLEADSSAYATIDPPDSVVAYASVSMMDTPPPDARAYMCWEPDGKGKWSKKVVLVKEIPNYFFSSI